MPVTSDGSREAGAKASLLPACRHPPSSKACRILTCGARSPGHRRHFALQTGAEQSYLPVFILSFLSGKVNDTSSGASDEKYDRDAAVKPPDAALSETGYIRAQKFWELPLKLRADCDIIGVTVSFAHLTEGGLL